MSGNHKDIIIIGSGGHASVLLDILFQQDAPVTAVSSNETKISRPLFKRLEHLQGNDAILAYSPEDVVLVNGVGALPGSAVRAQIHQRFTGLGYRFLTVVATSAIVSPFATLADGVQVLHQAVIQPGTQVEACAVINTKASVDHDCHIGFNNHIAPGATLSGQVTTGDNVHVGTGANIIQCVTVGENSVVGAGVTLTKNLADQHIVYPARNHVTSRK